DQTIPKPLTNIVSKCLERDPALRYASAAELVGDLEAWQGKGVAPATTLGFRPSLRQWKRAVTWPVLTTLATVLILATVSYVVRNTVFSKSARKVTAGPALSLAVVPFQNKSGDQSWDWLGPSLADMLSTDLGQSAHLSAVSS